MIFDSPEIKNYLMECVRKFPCNYEQALQYANAFGQTIQDGQVIPVAQQHEKFPPPKPLVPAKPVTPQVPAANRGNGSDPVAETCQENTDTEATKPGPDLTKGPAPDPDPSPGKK